MAAPEDGGGTDPTVRPERSQEDLVDQLSADPEALRAYVAETQAEMRELRQFAVLAAGCADAVLQRSERLTNTR